MCRLRLTEISHAPVFCEGRCHVERGTGGGKAKYDCCILIILFVRVTAKGQMSIHYSGAAAPSTSGGAFENGDGFGLIGGPQSDRDEQFEETLNNLTQQLRAHRSRAEQNHPLYEFVRSVQGAVGLQGDASTESWYDRHAFDTEVETIMTGLRQAHAFDMAKLRNEDDTSNFQAELARARARLNTARDDLRQWQTVVNQPNLQIALQRLDIDFGYMQALALQTEALYKAYSQKSWQEYLVDPSNNVKRQNLIAAMEDKVIGGPDKHAATQNALSIFLTLVKPVVNPTSLQGLHSTTASYNATDEPTDIQRDNMDALFGGPSGLARKKDWDASIPNLPQPGTFKEAFQQDTYNLDDDDGDDNKDPLKSFSISGSITKTSLPDVSTTFLVQPKGDPIKSLQTKLQNLAKAWSNAEEAFRENGANADRQPFTESLIGYFQARAVFLMIIFPAATALQYMTAILDEEAPTQTIPNVGEFVKNALSKYWENIPNEQKYDDDLEFTWVSDALKSMIEALNQTKFYKELDENAQAKALQNWMDRGQVARLDALKSTTTRDAFYDFLRKRVDDLFYDAFQNKLRSWTQVLDFSLKALPENERPDTAQLAAVIVTVLTFRTFLNERTKTLQNNVQKARDEEQQAKQNIEQTRLLLTQTQQQQSQLAMARRQEAIERAKDIQKEYEQPGVGSGPLAIELAPHVKQSLHVVFDLLRSTYVNFQQSWLRPQHLALAMPLEARSLVAKAVASDMIRSGVLAGLRGYTTNERFAVMHTNVAHAVSAIGDRYTPAGPTDRGGLRLKTRR